MAFDEQDQTRWIVEASENGYPTAVPLLVLTKMGLGSSTKSRRISGKLFSSFKSIVEIRREMAVGPVDWECSRTMVCGDSFGKTRLAMSKR